MALTAGSGLDILRHGPQFILPAILVQQVLAIAVAHLRHVCRLRKVADLTIDASFIGGVALASAHEAMRYSEADEDCETCADNNEEGYQDAVEGWGLVGGLAGHCGGRMVSFGSRAELDKLLLTSDLTEWLLWWRGRFRGVVSVVWVWRND